MGQALRIEVRQQQGYAIVTAAGEIDISTVTGLRERLSGLAASGYPLVVDLDQAGFIDSAGLAALAGTAKRAAAQRQPVRGSRPAEDPRAVPSDRAGLPDTAGPHPGRGHRGPDGSPDHTRLRRSP